MQDRIVSLETALANRIRPNASEDTSQMPSPAVQDISDVPSIPLEDFTTRTEAECREDGRDCVVSGVELCDS